MKSMNVIVCQLWTTLLSLPSHVVWIHFISLILCRWPFSFSLGTYLLLLECLYRCCMCALWEEGEKFRLFFRWLFRCWFRVTNRSCCGSFARANMCAVWVDRDDFSQTASILLIRRKHKISFASECAVNLALKRFINGCPYDHFHRAHTHPMCLIALIRFDTVSMESISEWSTYGLLTKSYANEHHQFNFHAPATATATATVDRLFKL